MKLWTLILILALALPAVAAEQTWTWSGVITNVVTPSSYAPTLKVGDTFSYSAVFDSKPFFPVTDNLIYCKTIDFDPVAFQLGDTTWTATNMATWWMIGDPGLNWPSSQLPKLPADTQAFGSHGQFWLPTGQSAICAGTFSLVLADRTAPYGFTLPVNTLTVPRVRDFDSATLRLDFQDGPGYDMPEVLGRVTSVTPEPATSLILASLIGGVMLKRRKM